LPKTLVLIADRDDDIGIKAGLSTPIIGRENVLEAANKLLLNDPEEADGNAMMGAIKVYDELKKSNEDCEIAAVSGD